jgi:hypothetical protein
MPPQKIARVVCSPRYEPTANDSDRIPSSSTAMTRKTPIATRRHGSRWFRMPVMTVAISRPCGAAALSLPMPVIHCTSICRVSGS